MVRQLLSRIAATGMALLALAAIARAETSLISKCEIIHDEASKPVASCKFRATGPAEVTKADLYANGNLIADGLYSPFSETGKSAWLFLIDTSNPTRAKTVASNVELVKTFMKNAAPNRLMGVATFDDKIEVILTPGDTYPDLDTRMASIKADGVATEFFATSLEAIKILQKTVADRKALVILSDGKAEDTAYTREDVVKSAKDAGVVIFGMGFAENGSDTPALQGLHRLADETDGPFISTIGDAKIPAEFVNGVTRFLENGGTVKAQLGDMKGAVDLTLSVRTADGSEFKAKDSLNMPVDQELVMEIGLPAKIYSFIETIWPGASSWADSNRLFAWLLLALPFLLILGAIAFMVTRVGSRSDQHEFNFDTPSTSAVSASESDFTFAPDESDATRALPNGGSASLGHFVMLDDTTNQFPIREKTISIGRHSDNEFRLNNDSVHRHHAHFHFTPDLRGIITDLNTVNGVVVNGKRIKQQELKTGDVIELGEVRFRYVQA